MTEPNTGCWTGRMVAIKDHAREGTYCDRRPICVILGQAFACTILVLSLALLGACFLSKEETEKMAQTCISALKHAFGLLAFDAVELARHTSWFGSAHHGVDGSFVPCPAAYSAYQTPTLTDVNITVKRAIARCGVQCDLHSNCEAFRYSLSDRRCVVLHNYNDTSGVSRDYQLCRKKELRKFSRTEAPLLLADEYVEQAEAEIPVGGNISVYALGSSSLLWMTWLDQLHLMLRRLGYSLPMVPPLAQGGQLYPTEVIGCDDTRYFEHLQTTRYGRIGWSSWDFSHEGWAGCQNGFRMIEGHKIKCQHGAGCAFSHEPVYASNIAEDAARSNITLIATWFNDDQQWSSHYKCFNGQKHSQHQLGTVTINCLLKTVRSIHAKNPHTWVVIMGKYPQTFHHITYKYLSLLNSRIRSQVEKEPRTLFVDYYMPNQDEGNFFQTAHSGHPNCRGSRIMAHAVLKRLYEERIISRGLRIISLDKKRLLNGNCSSMNAGECHSSGLCWVDPMDGKCKTYGPGSKQLHTVCKGTICEGPGPHVETVTVHKQQHA